MRIGVRASALIVAVLISGCSLPPFLGPAEPQPTVAPTSTVPTFTVPPSALPNGSTSPGHVPMAWDEVTETYGPSVLPLSARGCDLTTASGSSFVVAENLVMTAAHVVWDADAFEVTLGDGTVLSADLLALDLETDSALLRTGYPTRLQPLAILESEPRQASDLLVMGYPYFTDELFTSPGILGGHRDGVAYDSFTVGKVIVTSAATNPGNSGGPALDRWGRVVGLVSGAAHWTPTGVPVEGTNYLVPSPVLASNMDQWAELDPLTDLCGEAGSTDISQWPWLEVGPQDETARQVAVVLAEHGDGINTGDYYSAWVRLSPALRDRMGGFEQWQSGLHSSYWTHLEISSVTTTVALITVKASLTTEQDGEDGHQGQICSVYDMTYTLIENDEGGWMIDSADAQADPTAC